MTVNASEDHLHQVTGKTIAELQAQAKLLSLHTREQLLHWLSTEFELSHGHATAITHLLLMTPHAAHSTSVHYESIFKGSRRDWQSAAEELMRKIGHFGPDVKLTPKSDCLQWERAEHCFAVLSVTDKYLDIGIRLPGAPQTDRFTAAGSWNLLMTHRVRIIVSQQIDDELVSWLRQAYQQVV